MDCLGGCLLLFYFKSNKIRLFCILPVCFFFLFAWNVIWSPALNMGRCRPSLTLAVGPGCPDPFTFCSHLCPPWEDLCLGCHPGYPLVAGRWVFALNRWSCRACQVGFPSLSVGKRAQGISKIEKIMNNDKIGFLSGKIWQREGVSTAESVSYLPWRLSIPQPVDAHPEWGTESFIHPFSFLYSFILHFFYYVYPFTLHSLIIISIHYAFIIYVLFQ